MLVALAVASFVAAGWPSLATDVDTRKIGAEDAAIVAGVSRPFVLPEVKGAVENATEWYGWLTRARGVPVDHVTLLRDSEVTRESLKAAAEQAKTQVGKNGTLWIIFIGHGAPAKSGDDGLCDAGAGAARCGDGVVAFAGRDDDVFDAGERHVARGVAPPAQPSAKAATTDAREPYTNHTVENAASVRDFGCALCN